MLYVIIEKDSEEFLQVHKQQKDWGKYEPVAECVRRNDDKWYIKGQGCQCFVCLSLHQWNCPSGIPDHLDQSLESLEVGRTRSFNKVYLHKPMEAWWVSSMSVEEGSWCRCEAIQLSLNGHGERERFMKSGRKQSHSYFWEWQEDRSGQPYLSPWEADGVNPPGKHSQTHKGWEDDQE